MSKWVLISVVSLAVTMLLCFITLTRRAIHTNHRAKGLLEDLRSLDAAHDPTLLFASLKQKYQDQLSGEKCGLGVCTYELTIGDRILSTLHIASRTEMRTIFAFHSGSLTEVSLEYRSPAARKNIPVVHIQEVFCTTGPCDWFHLTPDGGNVPEAMNGTVQFGQKAAPNRKEAAWALNLDCMGAFGGCKDLSEMLPKIWKLTRPGRMSSLIRGTTDEIGGEQVLDGKSSERPVVDKSPTDAEQNEIYRSFLSWYFQEHGMPSGVVDTTDPFELPRFEFSCPKVMQLENITEPGRVVHKLSSEIVDGLNIRIVNPQKYNADLRLSEIVFDRSHRHAVFQYSTGCIPRCLTGATVMYEKKGRSWQMSGECASWIS